MSGFRCQVFGKWNSPDVVILSAAKNLFFILTSVFYLLTPAFCQTQVSISDTLKNADGTNASGRIVISWSPGNYLSGAVFRFVWTSTATAGNVVWGVAYRTVGGDDTTSLDQATAEETLSVTDAAPTATDRRLIPSVAATDINFSAGETVEYKICRNGTSASDTMAAAAQLFNAYFEYTGRP